MKTVASFIKYSLSMKYIQIQFINTTSLQHSYTQIKFKFTVVPTATQTPLCLETCQQRNKINKKLRRGEYQSNQNVDTSLTQNLFVCLVCLKAKSLTLGIRRSNLQMSTDLRYHLTTFHYCRVHYNIGRSNL